MKKRLVLLFVYFVGISCATFAASDSYSTELSEILSKLQSMGHGGYSDADWQAVMQKLDQISEDAAKNNQQDWVIEAGVIRAMVYSDMMGDHEKALDVLNKLRADYGQLTLPALRKVYVRQAEIYGKMGREDLVQQTIAEFKNSPHYDPETYAFTGGEGREVPLALTRPTAKGTDSLSVTAMEVQRNRARYSIGGYFPDISVVDIDGRILTSADFKGKVLLVDFWIRNWTPWRSDLPNLISTYQRYNPQGFEILGICLESNPSDIRAYAQSKGMAWSQVANDPALTRQLSIFGEATNYLIDQNGVIVGRDLRGADLIAAIKRALGQ